jgi:hypothetical protein
MYYKSLNIILATLLTGLPLSGKASPPQDLQLELIASGLNRPVLRNVVK